MTEPVTSPSPAGPPVVTPGASDKSARTAPGTGPAAPARATTGPPADPEAPYGWMTDPVTGEKRPKKRPGRGKGSKTVTPPRERPAAAPRVAKSAVSPPKDYTGDLAQLGQGIWFLLAGLPETDAYVGPVDLAAVGVRIKAQAAVLSDNLSGLAGGVNIMAQHSPPVRKAVEKITSESGPTWVIPAMMAMLPFAVASVSIWRAPVAGDVELLAKRTRAQLDETIGRMQPTPQGASDDQHDGQAPGNPGPGPT